MKNKELNNIFNKVNTFNKQMNEFQKDMNLMKKKYKIEKLAISTEFGVISELNYYDLMDVLVKSVEIPIVKLVQDKKFKIEDIPDIFKCIGVSFQENYIKRFN
ncbi:MAG: hypothetical protein FJ309_17590 [Planctomycetes bacterium]|nr:hypothetical protein [Planctomycetota bacterium]